MLSSPLMMNHVRSYYQKKSVQKEPAADSVAPRGKYIRRTRRLGRSFYWKKRIEVNNFEIEFLRGAEPKKVETDAIFEESENKINTFGSGIKKKELNIKKRDHEEFEKLEEGVGKGLKVVLRKGQSLSEGLSKISLKRVSQN